MLRSVFCLFLAMAAVMFVAGCTDNKSDNQLKLTIKNENTDTPVSGVTAILYNQDNTSYEPENIKVSGVDGVVDFGDVGREKVTVTFYYLRSPSTNEYEIESYVDVAPQVGDYFVDVNYSQVESCYNGFAGSTSSYVAKIAITFAKLPAEAFSVNMNSLGYAFYDLDDTGSYDFYVCPEDVQDDGKISLVMDVIDSSDRIIGYAYLLNQEINQGNTYTLEYSDTFTTLSVPATADANFRHAGASLLMGREFIWGLHSGAWAHEDKNGNDMINLAADAGTIGFTVPSNLPVSAYYLYVYGKYDGNTKSKVFFAGTPDKLDLTFSDIKITQFANSESERVIRWAKTGQAMVSYQMLNFSMQYDETLPNADRQSYNWFVYLPPEATMWSIMDLPVDKIAHDIPTELTRQSSSSFINHDFSSISFPGFEYRNMLNVEYARSIYPWNSDLLDSKYEYTSIGFTVNSDGVTYD